WEDALKHVRAQSTDLRIAAQGVERAEAQWRTALAGALLTVNGTGAYTHNLITNETLQPGGPAITTATGTTTPGFQVVRTPYPDFVTGSITANQPVLALRSWYAIGTADHSINAAQLSLEDTKRQIALGVANAIVAVVTAERIAELNRLGLRN